MEGPSVLKHIRDILILPCTVTVIVPLLIYDTKKLFLPGNSLITLLGVLLFLAGISLFLYTVYLFRTQGRGTLAPWTPTQQLVINGPYRYCRNPMISGVLFILLGETLFFHSIAVALWSAAFFFINTVYFIFKEEPDLYKRFGEAYRTYKKHVPRWIPRLSPYRHQLS